MAEEITGMACGLYEGLSPLPKDPVPGMSYVPYQQWDAQLHSPERALDAGTLFPILDKPFYGRRGEPPLNEEQMMRKRYYAARFACWELHLFLDTHPNNKEAARRLEEYQGRAARLRKEYEEKFGPLGETTQDTSRWAWISDPWPWEKEGN